MSDQEQQQQQEEEQETFESVGSGASLTYPKQAGALRKGQNIVIKGFPCKVIEITTSKTGKHGHAKANITAVDIFTGKKYEDICPTTHNVEVPNLFRAEYTVVDITADGYLSLMDDKGETKEDLKCPEDEFGIKIRSLFDAGSDILVTVVKAMGQEGVVAVKETSN
ncbi:eif5a [Acrasis kona]|uniref:Eukaryotic translation initiation factor 5A n=1 Tax=Acrasis kona TaxID=1008807 RepID=A0AAW2YRP9_9EUKA